jgi:hypothetical protein
LAKKTIQLPDGRNIEGEVVRPKKMEESWNVYELADGTTIRLKAVVSEIIRLDGEFTPDGDPVYLVKSSNVVTTEAPDELRRRPAANNPGSKSGQYL